MYAYVCVYIYTHIYIYTHTHIYIYYANVVLCAHRAWMFLGACHLGWRTVVLKCNKNIMTDFWAQVCKCIYIYIYTTGCAHCAWKQSMCVFERKLLHICITYIFCKCDLVCTLRMKRNCMCSGVRYIYIYIYMRTVCVQA